MDCQCGIFYPIMSDQEFGMHMMALAFYQTEIFMLQMQICLLTTENHAVRPVILGGVRIVTN